MASPFRYPGELPPPERDSYVERFEENRRSTEMEAGAVRRRRRVRRAARQVDLSFIYSQEDFGLFEQWWQDTIKGGERQFDIQLLDSDAIRPLLWFTVRVVGGVYDCEVTPTAEYRVSFTVRAVDEGFAVRQSGTDELQGAVAMGMRSVSGNILIFTPYRGNTSIGIQSAAAAFGLPPLRGSSAMGLLPSTRGRLGVPPLVGRASVGFMSARARFGVGAASFFSELSRQWMRLSWIRNTPTQDVNTAQEFRSREWME